MRFDNYLTEKRALSIKQLRDSDLFQIGYDDHFATEEFLEVAAKIRKECKFAIDLCRKNKRWFYRGLSGHHRKVGERSVRSDKWSEADKFADLLISKHPENDYGYFYIFRVT